MAFEKGVLIEYHHDICCFRQWHKSTIARQSLERWRGPDHEDMGISRPNVVGKESGSIEVKPRDATQDSPEVCTIVARAGSV